MPLFEAVAETIGTVVMETVFWLSERPQSACATFTATMAWGFYIRSGLNSGWLLFFIIIGCAALVGYGIGRILNSYFRNSRPARATICIAAAAGTLGTFVYLIFSA